MTPRLGDPPAIPTPVDKCPKCKKKDGWEWHWGSLDGSKLGYSECKSCEAKF